MNRRNPRTARDVLTALFELEADLTATPSASGGVLESLRLGFAGKQDDSAIWRRSVSADRRLVAYGDLQLAVRVLDPLDLEICRLRFWVPLDGHERIDRTVSESDLVDVPQGEQPNAPTVRQTRAGDEFVRQADTLDEDGHHVASPGRVLVRETRARWSSYASIVEALARRGIVRTESQVRYALAVASERIAAACAERNERAAGARFEEGEGEGSGSDTNAVPGATGGQRR